MANPSFWYYPNESQLLEIQLPAPLTELSWVPLRDRRSGWTIAGDMRSAVNTGRLRVTITLGPYNDTGDYQYLSHQLESMSAHLERGLPVSFAADRERAWLSEASQTTGSNKIVHGTNVCSAYNASAAFAVDDIMCLESPNPELNREYLRVTSIWSYLPQFLTATEVRYTYEEGPVMLRHRDFFPVLYLPEDMLGNSIVTHDHRLTFTLDVSLEQSMAGQVALVTGKDDGSIIYDGSDWVDAQLGAGNAAGAVGASPDNVQGYSLQTVIKLANKGLFGQSGANVDYTYSKDTTTDWNES